jgi:subtilisin family serine protease
VKIYLRKSVNALIAALLLAIVVVSAPPASAASTSQTFTVVLSDQAVSETALNAIRNAGGVVVDRIDRIGVLQVEADRPTAFLKAVLSNKAIANVGPSLEVRLDLPNMDEAAGQGAESATVADPMDYLWNIDRVTKNGAAWDIQSGTKDVVVGVIDTGFDFNHPDLKDNIVPGSKTFVPGTTDAWDAHSHGTHVAGTIAANGGIKGVAPNVGLRAYRVFNTGSAQQIWITNAIIAAADDRVDVINMSLGGTRVIGQWFYTDPATGERIALGNDAADWVAYDRAVNYAVQRGVTVVASAGNDAIDLSNKNGVTQWYNALLQRLGLTQYKVVGAGFKVPAMTPGVVTVSAMGGGFGTKDRLAFYSNYGSGAINVSAPGGDCGLLDSCNAKLRPADYYKYLVLSTVPTYLNCNTTAKNLFGNCLYGWKGGTSMASPAAAGVAALIISQEYARTGAKPAPAQVVTKLQQTTEDIGKVGYDNLYGHGLVDALRAVSR